MEISGEAGHLAQEKLERGQRASGRCLLSEESQGSPRHALPRAQLRLQRLRLPAEGPLHEAEPAEGGVLVLVAAAVVLSLGARAPGAPRRRAGQLLPGGA